jgi:hypothetical protein
MTVEKEAFRAPFLHVNHMHSDLNAPSYTHRAKQFTHIRTATVTVTEY